MRDIYLDESTGVLKNLLNIKDKRQLDEAEADYVTYRLKEIAKNPLPGAYDYAHILEMHKYIFQDIYEWAGQQRKLNIYKEEPVLGGLSIDYSEVFDIPKDAQFLASLSGELHHDHGADSDSLVILLTAGHELAQHIGHQALTACGAVIGGDIQVTDFSQFFFKDEQILGTCTDDTIGSGTMVVQPFHLRIDWGDTHTTADEDERTLTQFLSRHRGELGGFAQGTDDVSKTVAFLVFSHLLGGFTDGLEHDGHRTSDSMVVADGQRNTFGVFLHLDDEELARQS